MIQLKNVGICRRPRTRHDRTLSRLIHDRLAGLGLATRRGDLGQDSPNSEPFWSLRDISLHIAAGESVGVVGVNGAGKSTLLRVIAGIYRPTTGTVSISGKTVSLLALGGGFNPELTGRENVRLSGMLLGLSRPRIDQLIPDIVRFAGLADFIDRPVRSYSSGMVSRLAFALGTAIRPDVLLIDELLAVGDGGFRRRCEARLAIVMDHCRVMCLCSHNLAFVRRRCRRVVWLDAGRIVLDGTAGDVLERYEQYLLDRKLPRGGAELAQAA